jgi:hypothetical protein
MLFNTSSKKSSLNKSSAEEIDKILYSVSPLVKSIYNGGALFAIHKGLNQLSELFFYLLGLACIAFSFIMHSIFPFHVLDDIISKRIYEESTSKGDIQLFNMAVKALVIIIGLLCIFIGILIRNAGKRKSLLQQSGKILKELEHYFLVLQKEHKSDSIHDAGDELKKVDLLDFPKTQD